MTRQFTIEQAVERYFQERKSDLSDSTIYNYRSNLTEFIEWCDYQPDIQHVSDIDQFNVSDFQMHKRDDDGVADTTLYNVMMTLRTFIKWCEGKGLAEDIAENMMLPDRGRAAREETIDPETADEILEYLDKYEYATVTHALFAIMWDTGLRVGAVRSLDLDDYHPVESYIEVHHRPAEEHRGTPLKNQQKSEREVNLHEWVAEIVDDYIDGNRLDRTDKAGREPLLTTRNGRPARTTLRRQIRAITRPCHYTNECPIDREMEECMATDWNQASKCPESVTPHSIRRSAITTWLNEGHSIELVSDRMDVSPEVLKQHYDQRTEEQKRELRREMFEMD
jgi:integrase